MPAQACCSLFLLSAFKHACRTASGREGHACCRLLSGRGTGGTGWWDEATGGGTRGAPAPTHLCRASGIPSAMLRLPVLEEFSPSSLIMHLRRSQHEGVSGGDDKQDSGILGGAAASWPSPQRRVRSVLDTMRKLFQAVASLKLGREEVLMQPSSRNRREGSAQWRPQRWEPRPGLFLTQHPKLGFCNCKYAPGLPDVQLRRPVALPPAERQPRGQQWPQEGRLAL